jgi:aspartyl/asparaginyl beta-hydroxylase (cupin superfamily)
MARASLVPGVPVFDRVQFPWVESLESGAPAIRRELDGLLEYREHLPGLREIQPDQMKIDDDGRWKAFVLWGYGHRSVRGCERCPETAAVLGRIPHLESAWFSILAPGKHIPRHSGVTKGVIRCHLGLKVPRGGGRCEMRVADETVRWEEGRCVLFDDSYKHEVWNDTDEERVVLILDVRRPMRFAGRAAYAVLVALLRWSPFVRDARRNQEAWEERAEKVLPAAARSR